MKKSIALVLVMMMFVTMLSPMQAFSSDSSRINLFYKLDPSVQMNPDVDVYGTAMDVSTFQNGSNNNIYGDLYDYTMYSHASFEVGVDANFNISIYSYKTESLYEGSYTVDTSEAGDQIITIGFDPALSENAITFTKSPVPLDVTFSHEDPSMAVSYAYNFGKVLHTNKAVEPGSYQMYYTKYDNFSTPSTLKLLTETVIIDGLETSHVGTVTETSQNIMTVIESGSLNITTDNLHFSNHFVTGVNGVSQIETNLIGLERFIVAKSLENTYELIVSNLELNQPINLSNIQEIATSTEDYQSSANINNLFSFNDANGHPIRFNYINGGSFQLEATNGSKSGQINGSYIDLNNLSGLTTVTIDIPDLGIHATRTINVISNNTPPPPPPPTAYKDMLIEVNDFNAPENPQVGVFSVYEPEKNNITLYVPQNSVSKLIFKGVKLNDEITEPLVFSLNNQSHPQNNYYDDTKQLLLGAVQGGYRDMLSGNVGNVSVSINVYKGTLGKITLENYDSTEENPSYYSGEVEYSTSYKYTDGNMSGSMSNGWAHKGTFFIPMLDGALGVSYAYGVISPTRSGNSEPQANTKFLDFSDKIAVINNGFIELGNAKFQEPTFKGVILNSEGNPVSDIKTRLTTVINSELIDLHTVSFDVGMWSDETVEKNIFYFAPLGESFEDAITVNVSSFQATIKPFESSFNDNEITKVFQDVKDQLVVSMLNPDGNPLESGQGLDRQIYLVDNVNQVSRQAYIGKESTANIGELTEGVSYTLKLKPDLGDFTHLRYMDGKSVTFTYTSFPGEYHAVDSIGDQIPYVVDANGVMHLALSVQYAQVYGQIYLDGISETLDTSVVLYEKGSQNIIGNGRIHTSGGYNGQPTEFGLFMIGNDTPLIGEYTLVVEDPKDTVMYSGTSVDITLPLTEPLNIELPKSKVFGKVMISPEDTMAYENNITRIYVNVFDAAGQFLKNVLVRRDGMFSVGELESGKYFAKVFVSPFSSLATKYASSQMTVFDVDQSTENITNFDANLTRVIGEGTIFAPNSIPKPEAWVRIYNAQGVEIEAVKSNEQGIFKVPMLQDGIYKVRAFGTDGFTDSLISEFTVVEGVLTSDTLKLYLTLPQLTGLAVDSGNNTINDVTAMLFDKDKNLISSLKTQNGDFSFGGLDNGKYYIQVRPNVIGAFMPSNMVEFQYAGDVVNLTVALENASYQGKVLTPSGTIQKSGWVHVYLDNSYETSVQIDQLGRFILGEFDPGQVLTIVAEDDMGRFMPSEKIILNTQETVELRLRSEIGYKSYLMYGEDVLMNTKYIVYDSTGNALYQGKANAFGEMTLVDVPFGDYTVVVPMETSYLIGQINFTFDGQHFEGIPLIKGEIK